ncbi:DeoR/GlpR family DNA-binding transcription regulator [Saccharopolyspora phatthalungensis]|uniref:DeoR/GlpR family transcriptional regulator of sugar metabolism n=1 Tax=Saccharopolyspora phatthalungensis TaxID=664693 RepID=A0A840QJZ3_9PSEU|nr:DeoR/GlpR family DNA-binding transcription regulator [Saccharopolyspora phatthalungensis]MBB5158433.1 DeoR/GlpR family transcriptional regulator of sugar metabolism [Saccharopolyspora phatthalungensis]
MASRGSEAEVEQRRQSVLRQVADEGEVRIDDLARRLGVSVMTIHRDLDNLQDRKLLHKRRGFAAAFSTVTMESSLRFRENANQHVKEAICEVLAAQVSPGNTVLLDCGSTLFPLVRRLADVEGIRVITNSLRVTYLLGGAGVDVTLLGDTFYEDFESCAGPEIRRQLQRIRVDIAFVTATCVSEGKLYHPVREYAENKEAYLRIADRAALAVDHTKFGRTATYAYGDLSGYDLLVTDAAVPEDELRTARGLGLEIRIVDTEA